MGCRNTIAQKNHRAFRRAFGGKVVWNVIGTKLEQRAIGAELRRGAKSRREHLEILEVGAVVSGGFYTVLPEGSRNEVRSNLQLGSAVTSSLEFLRCQIGHLVTKIAFADRRHARL